MSFAMNHAYRSRGKPGSRTPLTCFADKYLTGRPATHVQLNQGSCHPVRHLGIDPSDYDLIRIASSPVE